MSDVYEIKQPSELLITINALQSEIKLSKEDAQVILGYMQGHDFMVSALYPCRDMQAVKTTADIRISVIRSQKNFEKNSMKES